MAENFRTAEGLESCKRRKVKALRILLTNEPELVHMTQVLRSFEGYHALQAVMLENDDEFDSERRNWNPHVFMGFFEVLAGFDNLESLSFCDTLYIPLRAVTFLIQRMGPRLKSLELNASFIATSEQLGEFVQVFEKAKRLEKFTLFFYFSVRTAEEEEDDDFAVSATKKAMLNHKIISTALKHKYITEFAFAAEASSRETILSVVNNKNIHKLKMQIYQSPKDDFPSPETVKALQANASLRSLKIENNSYNMLPYTGRGLRLLGQILRHNTVLEELDIEDRVSDATEVLIDVAHAVSQNPQSALCKFQIYVRDNQGEESPYTTAVEKAFVELLRSNYELHTVNFWRRYYLDEGPIILRSREEQIRFPAIDFYLRLNRSGRKELMTDPHSVPRETWVANFSSFSNDAAALYYYLQANPWLIPAPRHTKLIVRKRAIVSDGEMTDGTKKARFET